jgi:hypothetical protein
LERYEKLPGIDDVNVAAALPAVAAAPAAPPVNPYQEALNLYNIVMKILMMMDNIHDFAKGDRSFQEDWTPYTETFAQIVTPENVTDVIDAFWDEVQNAEMYKPFENKIKCFSQKCATLNPKPKGATSSKGVTIPGAQPQSAQDQLKKDPAYIFQQLVNVFTDVSWKNVLSGIQIKEYSKIQNAMYKIVYKSLLLFYKKLEIDESDVLGQLTDIISKINMFEKKFQEPIKLTPKQKQSSGTADKKQVKQKIVPYWKDKPGQPPSPSPLPENIPQPNLCPDIHNTENKNFLLQVLVHNLNSYIRANLIQTNANTPNINFNNIFRTPYERYFTNQGPAIADFTNEKNLEVNFDATLDRLVQDIGAGFFDYNIFRTNWEKNLLVILSKWGRIKTIQLMKYKEKGSPLSTAMVTLTAHELNQMMNPEPEPESLQQDTYQSWLSYYIKDLDWCNDTIGTTEIVLKNTVLATKKNPVVRVETPATASAVETFETKYGKTRTLLVTSYFDGCLATTSGRFGIEVAKDRDKGFAGFDFSINFSDQSTNKVTYRYSPRDDINQLVRNFGNPDFGQGGTYQEDLVYIDRDTGEILGTTDYSADDNPPVAVEDAEEEGKEEGKEEEEDELPICEVGKDCTLGDGTKCRWKRIDILSISAQKAEEAKKAYELLLKLPPSDSQSPSPSDSQSQSPYFHFVKEPQHNQDYDNTNCFLISKQKCTVKNKGNSTVVASQQSTNDSGSSSDDSGSSSDDSGNSSEHSGSSSDDSGSSSDDSGSSSDDSSNYVSSYDDDPDPDTDVEMDDKPSEDKPDMMKITDHDDFELKYKKGITGSVGKKAEDSLLPQKQNIRHDLRLRASAPAAAGAQQPTPVNSYYDLTDRIKRRDQEHTPNIVKQNEYTQCMDPAFINNIGFFTTLKALGDFAQCKEAYARKCMFISQDSMQFLLGSVIGTMMIKNCAVKKHDYLKDTRYWVSNSLFNKIFSLFYKHNSPEGLLGDIINRQNPAKCTIKWWFYDKPEPIPQNRNYTTAAYMKFLKMYKIKNNNFLNQLNDPVLKKIHNWFPLTYQNLYKIILEGELHRYSLNGVNEDIINLATDNYYDHWPPVAAAPVAHPAPAPVPAGAPVSPPNLAYAAQQNALDGVKETLYTVNQYNIFLMIGTPIPSNTAKNKPGTSPSASPSASPKGGPSKKAKTAGPSKPQPKSKGKAASKPQPKAKPKK